jgi:DNA-binding response OmpR family regulator
MTSSPKRVLIADDDEHIRTVVSELVEHAGFAASAVAGGVDAVAQIAAQPPALLILDVDMPDMGGFEVLQRVREAGFNAPVVMLTARSRDEHVLEGYKHGADYYVTKPFQMQTLLNILQYMIGDLTEAERRALETKL